MERYIRTKDGKVYDTEKYAYTWTTPKGIGLGISATENILIPKSLIERQADNLEELCDCFVCVGSWHCVWDKETHKGITLDGIKLSYSLANFEIYGAIWTDKGLIYKAKINEKGEFEIL